MSKHTEGPWVVREDDDDGNCWTIEDYRGGHVAGFLTSKANADLLAASPELLDACKEVRRDIYKLMIPQLAHSLRILDAAIAKSEGRK